MSRKMKNMIKTLLLCILFFQNSYIYCQLNGIVDIENRDYSKLKSIFENKKLVLIGEHFHADGNVDEERYKIVSYLHDSLGFNVLLMEKSFYGVNVLFDNYFNKEDSLKGLFAEFFHCRADDQAISKEYLEFIDYFEKLDSKNKLFIHGFDFYQRDFCRDIYDDFYSIVNKDSNTDEIEYAFSKLYLKGLLPKYLWHFDELRVVRYLEMDSINAWENTLSGYLRKKIEISTDSIQRRKLLFFIKIFQNQVYYYQFIKINQKERFVDGIPTPDTHKFRDSLMADNILWYINEFYPNEKIIIAATSMHNSRYMNEIEGFSKEFYGKGTKTMGEILYERYKDSFYSIAFIGIHDPRLSDRDGKASEILSKHYNSKKGLEYQLKQNNYKQVFIDLRTDNADSKFCMFPTFNRPYYTQWSKHYDGVIFLERIKHHECMLYFNRIGKLPLHTFPDNWYSSTDNPYEKK